MKKIFLEKGNLNRPSEYSVFQMDKRAPINTILAKLLCVKVDILTLQCIDNSDKLLSYMRDSNPVGFVLRTFLGIVCSKCYIKTY